MYKVGDKLIEIAKANGASINKTFAEGPHHVHMTEEQLHATIEQVCAPLIGALMTANRVIPKGLYGSQAEKEFGFIMKAVADYHAIIGSTP